MVEAELDLVELKCLCGQLDGIVEPIGFPIGPGEAPHALERLEVGGAELGFPELERPLEQRNGLEKPSVELVVKRDVEHAMESVGVVGAELVRRAPGREII